MDGMIHTPSVPCLIVLIMDMLYPEKVPALFGQPISVAVLNCRWVMFGVFVGLLTEYSTGVDFVNQLKLMVSYLGIADIYD